MPEAWELSDDEPCPLPEEYYNLCYIDGSFDRISMEEGERVKRLLNDPSNISIEYESLVGGRMFVMCRMVVGMAYCTPEVRALDRHHSRWLTWEAKQDKYLKELSDDD